MTTCGECKTSYDSHTLPEHHKSAIAERGYQTNCPVCAFLLERKAVEKAERKADDIASDHSVMHMGKLAYERDNTLLIAKLREVLAVLDADHSEPMPAAVENMADELTTFLEPYNV